MEKQQDQVTTFHDQVITQNANSLNSPKKILTALMTKKQDPPFPACKQRGLPTKMKDWKCNDEKDINGKEKWTFVAIVIPDKQILTP